MDRRTISARQDPHRLRRPANSAIRRPSILIAELFERHDRNRFALYAFDNGWDDGSALRKRINQACDEIVDIAGLDDLAAAAAIRQREIDILVDLNGYFGLERDRRVRAAGRRRCRSTISAFPARMGADYIDYIIADAHRDPAGRAPSFYTEKVV